MLNLATDPGVEDCEQRENVNGPSVVSLKFRIDMSNLFSVRLKL